MSEISIRLRNVDVSFKIYEGMKRSVRHKILAATTGGRVAKEAHSTVTVEALRNITFSLRQGDRLALIGHNGAGKSTLLRVLSGIYEPNAGQVEIKGRVTSIFDAVTGFDMEATGFDNIRIRGLYLGRSNDEIKERTGEIIEFTELGDFLAVPVRTYSAGMLMRLAFGISTAFEPEILILDEGIGAGDAAFVAKANKRLEQFIDNAGIMVLASHSNDLVSRFCNKGIVLEHGGILFGGRADAALQYYQEQVVG
jgi:ABC-2 type transport system ATP-binding protein